MYRASRDGFGALEFHSKCDGIPNTLTVLKAKDGSVYGGFTEKRWHSRNDWVKDPKAFVFDLRHGKERTTSRDEIGCFDDRGPIFIQSKNVLFKPLLSFVLYIYGSEVNIGPLTASSLIPRQNESTDTIEIEVFTKAD